tara:strand:+ start:296 stop:532 length:237 start_codon:yes stop_codon:yes gene_type:complete
MSEEVKTDELVTKILKILSWQAVITSKGASYDGEKDWALNQILDLLSQALQKRDEEWELKMGKALYERENLLLNKYYK